MTRVNGLRLIRGVGVAAALALLPSTVRAASVDWSNGSGDGKWNTPANWSTNAVVSGGDDAAFINPVAGPANITADIPVLRDIRFGDDARPGGGVVNQSAGNAILNGWFRMGVAAGTGTYNLSGGTLQAGAFKVSEVAGALGTVSVTGSGTLRQPDIGNLTDQGQWNFLGQGGTGTFNLSGNGTISLDSRTLIGAAGTSQGNVVTQTGGVFEIRHHELVIADTGETTYNISGGTLQTLASTATAAPGNITVGQWDNSNGKLNVSGNAVVMAAANLNLAAGQPTAPSTGTVTQTGGIVRVGTSGNGDLSMAVNGPGVATYTLQGGILDLTGGNIIKGSGTATFTMTGGELRDVFSMNIPLNQAGGTVHPSDVEGGMSMFRLTGDYTEGAGANLLIDLDGTGNADELHVVGTATLAGRISVNVLGDGVVPVGTEFVVLTPDTLVGTFTNGSFVTADTGQRFSISYAGGDGNDVVLTAQAVPEPAGAAIVGLVAAGWVARRRKS